MEKKRILITGVNGLLGQNLAQALQMTNGVTGVDLQEKLVDETLRVDYRTLDLTNREAVFKTISELKPNWIINTAALTAVDACESNQEC